ncbi:hypothetical protein CBR_g52400 [Chara braunii]|uniref:Uncharacterized protein n=1 Tax=Chara braunii TaxID=69332 RepID=A0A388MAA3_CHABU|nr:hypothetical protein CBR_g52400 [Chara braunii]|eukprot:GBG91445.1 hypothetical protein CBR_g52400 [Chara braunii]
MTSPQSGHLCKSLRKRQGISEEAQCAILLGLLTASEASELTSHGGGSATLTCTTIDKGVEDGSLDQVEQHQMRLQRRKRKERDATASGTPGVKRIVTDVLAELGYDKDAEVQKKVVTVVQGHVSEVVDEETGHEDYGGEETGSQVLTKAQHKQRNLLTGGQGSGKGQIPQTIVVPPATAGSASMSAGPSLMGPPATYGHWLPCYPMVPWPPYNQCNSWGGGQVSPGPMVPYSGPLASAGPPSFPAAQGQFVAQPPPSQQVSQASVAGGGNQGQGGQSNGGRGQGGRGGGGRGQGRNGGGRGGGWNGQGGQDQGGQDGQEGGQGYGRPRFDWRNAICRHCGYQGYTIRFCQGRRDDELSGLISTNMDRDIYDKFGKYIDPKTLGGVRQEAQRRASAGPTPPTMFRMWQESEDPTVRVEEVAGESEEVTQRLKAGTIKEEPIVVESDDEDLREEGGPTVTILEKMEDLLEKVGGYQQKLKSLCDETQEWRDNLPEDFLYESGPESSTGQQGYPRVATVGSGPRSGMTYRPPTSHGRVPQAARTRSQNKAGISQVPSQAPSQAPPRKELEPERRKEVMEAPKEDEEDDDEEDERLGHEEDRQAELRAGKRGVQEEDDPSQPGSVHKRKKYAVRLEEGFDVERMVDRLLEGHNDLMNLKDILASAPRLRDGLKGRLSRSGMVDTGAETNIIRERKAIMLGMEIDRSDHGMLHGANCKVVFCGTTSNVIVEIGKGLPIRLEEGNAQEFIPAYEQYMRDQGTAQEEWMQTLLLWTRRAERPLARQIRDRAHDWEDCQAQLRQAFRRPEPERPDPNVERMQRRKRLRDPETRGATATRRGRKALAQREELVEPTQAAGSLPTHEHEQVEFRRITSSDLQGPSPRLLEEGEGVPSEAPLRNLEAHLDASQWGTSRLGVGLVEPARYEPTEGPQGPELGTEPHKSKEPQIEEVITVRDDTPPRTPVPERVQQPWSEGIPEPNIEEVPVPLPETITSPPKMVEAGGQEENEEAGARATIDPQLAEYVIEHSDTEMPTSIEPSPELPHVEGGVSVEALAREAREAWARRSPGETAEEKSVRVQARLAEIYEKIVRMGAAGEAPAPPIDPKTSEQRIDEMSRWARYESRRDVARLRSREIGQENEGADEVRETGDLGFSAARLAIERAERRVRQAATTSFHRYTLLSDELAASRLVVEQLSTQLAEEKAENRAWRAHMEAKEAEWEKRLQDMAAVVERLSATKVVDWTEQSRYGIQGERVQGLFGQGGAVEPPQQEEIKKVSLDPAEVEAKRKAEEKSFSFKAPTELASQQATPAEEPAQRAQSPPAEEGFAEESPTILLEVRGGTLTGAVVPTERETMGDETSRLDELVAAMEVDIPLERPQRLDTPEYRPGNAGAQGSEGVRPQSPDLRVAWGCHYVTRRPRKRRGYHRFQTPKGRGSPKGGLIHPVSFAKRKGIGLYSVRGFSRTRQQDSLQREVADSMIDRAGW